MTVPAPMITAPNPAFLAAVARRARDLCVRAEPHASPGGVCAIHESEARRQLFDQWQREGGGS